MVSLITTMVSMETGDISLLSTSASICTINRMSGEALSNKCFIMPKALNDHRKKSFVFNY